MYWLALNEPTNSSPTAMATAMSVQSGVRSAALGFVMRQF
jgi:hypothetical protein